MLPSPSAPLFRSFWLGGFESACHINRSGRRVDMICATAHDTEVERDYAMLAEFGISTVRDGMRWHLIDRGPGHDFSSVRPVVDAARQHGIQVVWNLFHYGWPDDVSIFARGFIDRFARYCAAAARFVTEAGDETPFFAPVNEISFLSWAVGEVGHFFPHAPGTGRKVKHQLVRAAIAGMEAIWSVAPAARMAHTDPIFHVVPPRHRPDLARAAAEQRASQFEAWDMLVGGLDPGLGGHPKYLDAVGVNFYHANQWEHPETRLRWEDEPRDPRWLPLRALLTEVYHRYNRPLFIAETSHVGVGRGRWIREVADEVRHARTAGVPVEGICIYPIVDRPDWEDPNHWHNSGLWDLRPDPIGRLERLLCQPYAEDLRVAQALLSEPHPAAH